MPAAAVHNARDDTAEDPIPNFHIPTFHRKPASGRGVLPPSKTKVDACAANQVAQHRPERLSTQWGFKELVAHTATHIRVP